MIGSTPFFDRQSYLHRITFTQGREARFGQRQRFEKRRDPPEISPKIPGG
jgi:hypothetical protein